MATLVKVLLYRLVVKIKLVGGEPVGYFTRVAEDLNSGIPRKNPASGQGRA